MVALDVLIKSITLLHRERLLEGQTDNSGELVKTILEVANVGNNKYYNGSVSELMENLKHLILDMINNPDNYDKENLLQSLYLIIKDNDNLIKVVEKSINVELSEPSLKRTVISLRNTLNNYYKEEQIKKLLSQASYKIATGNIEDGNVVEFASKLVTNIDALTMVTKTKDPGVVDEIDIGDEDNMSHTLDKVKEQSVEGGKLKTGWKELNEMLQGGFRRTEMVMINALQHKYKSGFIRSLFMQLPIHNVPKLDDKNKKPLMAFISFEDDADVMLDFMYKYLYYNEHNELPDLTSITTKEVANYIRRKLSVNGYHIKILRVNPNEWTYKNLFNKILEYEAAGYEIHSCFIDYLEKLPTTGCISGPVGTDLRDLFNRCRNFFVSKRILLITPHQLSSEAKQLVRNGVPDISFVKEVRNKGYTGGSKLLDQIVDLELYIHIAYLKRKPYLTIARGKHRIPSIIEEEKLYFVLPFPKGAPIKENVNEEGESTSSETISGDNEFDF